MRGAFLRGSEAARVAHGLKEARAVPPPIPAAALRPAVSSSGAGAWEPLHAAIRRDLAAGVSAGPSQLPAPKPAVSPVYDASKVRTPVAPVATEATQAAAKAAPAAARFGVRMPGFGILVGLGALGSMLMNRRREPDYSHQLAYAPVQGGY